MSVRNAGAAIREARLKAGLTQEQLSEGVCSVLSLSRIENGTAGVSPSTFQALMAHAGAPCEAFPIFANRNDFDCFYALKRVGFYIDSWQLKEAYEELEKIEEKNWAENKYYYQEWLLMHCKLQFRSGVGNHQQIYDNLLFALHISRPAIDFFDFRNLLLSLTEIELLILLAQETLYLNKLELCLSVCTQISIYLENTEITFLEKDRLLAEHAIVYAKYLITTKEYVTAFELTEKFRLKMIKNLDDAPLHELTFLSGIGHYYQNQHEDARILFKTTFYSAHSIESCYATICRNYLVSVLGFDLPDTLLSVPDIPLFSYEAKKTIDISTFTDGTYDPFSSNVLTIGGLIRELRIEQRISQKVLCQGLCSKSKLSKIENGTLQLDIALAQSLLQRLGVSDTIFTFYGNTKESKLQDLRLRLTKIPLSNIVEIEKYSQKMIELCSQKEILYAQYASYRKACCVNNSKESSTTLFYILKQTLPEFDFNNIRNFRLSWLELTIANNYCPTYSLDFPSKGILCMYKLLEYYDFSQMDILEKRRVFPITLHLLVRFLYRERRFAEIIDLNPHFSSHAIKGTLTFSGLIYSHYSQSLLEIGQKDFALLYVYYAYYNFLITNSTSNAINLKHDLETDFDIFLL